MFLFQYTLGQNLRRVICKDRHSRLDNNSPGIQFGDHEVHTGSGFGVSGIERALVRVQPRIFRQQGRMDIEKAACVMRDERWHQDAHKSGQHDSIDAMAVNFGHQGVIKFFARELRVIDNAGWNAGLGGAFKSFHAGTIADHEGNFCVENFCIDRIDESLQIAAAA